MNTKVIPQGIKHINGLKSISDDDLCATCPSCVYKPGELSQCALSWPGQVDEDGYVTACASFPVQPQPGAQPASPTKLLRVTLRAFVLLEHSELIEVPSNLTPAEQQALIDDRYTRVEGGDYTSDYEYWRQGECTAEEVTGEGLKPMLMAFRVESGLHVERAECAAPAQA